MGSKSMCGKNLKEEKGDFVFQESQRFLGGASQTHREHQQKVGVDIADSNLQMSARCSEDAEVVQGL